MNSNDRRFFFALAVLAMLVALSSACGGSSGDDEDEEDELQPTPPPTLTDLISDETGYPWSFSVGDIGAAAPEDWTFLFAFRMTDTQSETLAGSWAVDFGYYAGRMIALGSSLKKEGLDLSVVNDQAALFRIETMDGETRLRFTAKLLYSDGIMRIDPQSGELLGSPETGDGWYAAYASQTPYGFLRGEAAPCAGDPEEMLVTGARGDFFTRPDADGAFALPARRQDSAHDRGSPAVSFLYDGQCFGAVSYALTDVRLDPDPKCEAVDAPENCSPPEGVVFDDGTVATARTPIDLANEGATIPATTDCVNCDFESGDAAGWFSLAAGGEETPAGCFGAGADAYADLFPDATEQYYGYLTTGGDRLRTCSAYRSIVAPAGVSKLIVSYNLATQEYPDGIGSAYGDSFFIWKAGTFARAAFRTTADEIAAPDFEAIPTSAALLAGIADSADAAYSEEGAVFTGYLRSEARVEASVSVTPGEEFLFVIGVADAGDPFGDTAAFVDSVRFE